MSIKRGNSLFLNADCKKLNHHGTGADRKNAGDYEEVILNINE